MCIVIVCYPVYDVINFEIKLSFLIKPFSYMTKMSGLNLNIFRTKRTFKIKQKAFFIVFKGVSVVRNCLRPESVSLTFVL